MSNEQKVHASGFLASYLDVSAFSQSGAISVRRPLKLHFILSEISSGCLLDTFLLFKYSGQYVWGGEHSTFDAYALFRHSWSWNWFGLWQSQCTLQIMYMYVTFSTNCKYKIWWKWFQDTEDPRIYYHLLKEQWSMIHEATFVQPSRSIYGWISVF
jgi:hypothetical protein